MAYTGWLLSDHTRDALLAAFPPLFPDHVCHHVTETYGVAKDCSPPAESEMMVVGYALGEGIEAFVVSVNGTTIRPDGEVYHVTLSLDREAGLRPKDSKALVRDGHIPLAPVAITAKPETFY